MNAAKLTHLAFGIGVVLCMIATSFVLRHKTTDVANGAAMHLLTQATSDACFSQEAFNHAEKLQSDSTNEEIHFVGCGGFF
jgi:hypothetical protein